MMRVSALPLLALAALSTTADANDDKIVQSLYVPLPDQDLLYNIFDKIQRSASSPLTSLISVAVSTDDTVIYYDHWEDGFDADITGPNRQSTSEVWGDGNKDNGCAPIPGRACTDEDDYLNSGDVAILSDSIPIPRKKNQVLFDGGDLVQATRPVAMTRAGYPSGPGSMMAGAVEVIEQAHWGSSFIAPVGQDVRGGTSAYEFTAFACMAGESGTQIRVKGRNYNLRQGQSRVIRVNQGDTLTSNKPVQVHLITGDIRSTYELRWYSLTPTEQWSNEAFAPVGDSKGKVKITIYNPSNSPINVEFDTLTASKTIRVPAKSEAVSAVIPDGQAAHLKSDDNFFAFSSTDTGGSGQIFDWGYPLMTREQLTDQVLIGLGHGCTGNSCDSKGERSVVWVTPVENAYIHIDFDNDGVVDDTRFVRMLESSVITDKDEDMSGAIIWATTGSSPSSEAVDLAAAWGQKAALSGSGDLKALDLGTVVVPFEPVRTSCSIAPITDVNSDGIMNAGDEVEQTIEVINSGVKPIVGGTIAVETLTGTVNIQRTGEKGGTQTYRVRYVIPRGQAVSETCETSIVPAVETGAPTTSPTDPPTDSPTVSPTDPPTDSPTASPTDPPTDAPKPEKRTITVAPKKGSTSGDPHFKTWTGEKYDYHGECDLVLLDDPSFNNGQGMRVHIRTTHVKYFSYVEQVAVQIGDEVLEFDNDAENFLINGEKVGENMLNDYLGGFFVRRDKKAISIRLLDEKTPEARRAGKIAKIDLHTRKNGFPAVIIDAGHTDMFRGSLGLLGDWATGHKLARDGETEIEVDNVNAEAFALEWQVRDTDPMLFKDVRFPQWPTTCTPPAKMVQNRLGMEKARKEAEEACAHWAHDKDDCVFDVMATRDVLVAEEGHIVHVE